MQGAAIWLSPGLKAFDFPWWRELFYTPLFLSIAGGAGLKRAQELGARLTSCHPVVPHAHLQFLGVSSEAQGQGVGSALLKATLALGFRGAASAARSYFQYLPAGHYQPTQPCSLPARKSWPGRLRIVTSQ